MTNTKVKSFNIPWCCININIKIVYHIDSYYMIVFEDKVLGVVKLDNVKDYINVQNVFTRGFVEDCSIVPLLGQNKMYATSIIDNIITFNNGKQSPIDDIQYEISKFLLRGNPLYDLNLYQNKINYQQNKKHS